MKWYYLVLGLLCAFGVALVTYFAVVQAVVDSRLVEWSSRPEIENWANPAEGAAASALPAAGISFVIVVVCWTLLLVFAFGRSRLVARNL